MWISHSTTSQKCSIRLNSGCFRGWSTVNEWQCTHLKLVSGRYMNFVTWCIIVLEVAIRRWVPLKGCTWSAPILRCTGAFTLCTMLDWDWVVHRKYSSQHYTSNILSYWCKGAWIIVSCCLCQILTRLSECCSWNWDLSHQAMLFQSSIVQLWVCEL